MLPGSNSDGSPLITYAKIMMEFAKNNCKQVLVGTHVCKTRAPQQVGQGPNKSPESGQPFIRVL